MGSPKFDALDLELLDRVYAVACVYIEAENLCRIADAKDTARKQAALRKQIFAIARTGPLKFDPLCDKVLSSIERSARA